VSRIEPMPTTEGACPLCATPAPVAASRCPECGYDLAGVGGRPGPFSRTVFVLSAMGLLAVYLVTLAIVVLTR
jgi:hypothetical protein